MEMRKTLFPLSTTMNKGIHADDGAGVFVRNLDKGTDNEALKAIFSDIGSILSCQVTSNGSGCGFVIFETDKAANQAIEKFNGMLIQGKKIDVKRIAPGKERIAHMIDKLKHFKDLGNDLHDEWSPDISGCFDHLPFPEVKQTGLDRCEEEERRAHLASQYLQQTAQFNQMFQPTGAGYFVPTMPQAQRGFFAPTQMPQVRASPRWQTQVRPQQPAGGFQGMPTNAQMRATAAPRTGQPTQPAGGPSSTIAGIHGPANRSVYMYMYMHNPPTAVPQSQVMQQQPQPSVVIPGQEPLTASMLAAAPPQERKQMLGERLFPLIQRLYPDLAGKITGMLLEIDNSELLHVLESNESLKAKVDEALAVLQAHAAKENSAGVKEMPSTGGIPGPANRAGFMYNPTMRNPPTAVLQSQVMQKPSVVIPGQEPLTASMLAAAPPQEQKQMLGERLFPLIQRLYPDLAGKITGMLLEIDNSELLHMLKSTESLKAKVDEAVAVLQAHQAKEAAAMTKKE